MRKKTAKFFNLKNELIIPIHSSELKLSVERKNIHLNNDKLFKKTKHKMIGIDDGLESMVNAYNNSYS